MSKKQILASETTFAGQRLAYSNAVRAGDLIFLAGQAPLDGTGAVVVGGIEAQTRQAMENISKLLRDIGAELSDVVRVNIYLSDPRDFFQFDRVYRTYFESEPPTRTTVHAPLVIDAKVEIEAIAYKPL